MIDAHHRRMATEEKSQLAERKRRESELKKQKDQEQPLLQNPNTNKVADDALN